jgi:type II secretory pathway component PulM
MSTPAQISANIANAKLSSGPRTDTGKATSAKNGITLGLFTSGDFVRPSEREAYASLQAQLNLELAPVGVLETTLVEEIRRATWKLRRCGEVEANLAPSADDATSVDETTPDPLASDDARAEKIQRSVDRARAQAHRLLHKCTAELRRLQTDRHYAQELFFEGADTSDIGIADWRAITKAHGDRTRVELRQKKLDKLHNTLAMVQRVASEAGRNLTATMQTQSAAENAA